MSAVDYVSKITVPGTIAIRFYFLRKTFDGILQSLSFRDISRYTYSNTSSNMLLSFCVVTKLNIAEVMKKEIALQGHLAASSVRF